MGKHEKDIREKLDQTRRSKLNRYSESHFDPPITDPRLRAWFVRAADRARRQRGGDELFGAMVPRIIAHVTGDGADVALFGFLTGSRDTP